MEKEKEAGSDLGGGGEVSRVEATALKVEAEVHLRRRREEEGTCPAARKTMGKSYEMVRTHDGGRRARLERCLLKRGEVISGRGRELTQVREKDPVEGSGYQRSDKRTGREETTFRTVNSPLVKNGKVGSGRKNARGKGAFWASERPEKKEPLGEGKGMPTGAGKGPPRAGGGLKKQAERGKDFYGAWANVNNAKAAARAAEKG